MDHTAVRRAYLRELESVLQGCPGLEIPRNAIELASVLAR